MTSPLVILTRGSRLALWQAGHVRDLLAAQEIPATLEIVESEGDRDRTTPLDRTDGQGFFTKALQRRLLEGVGDLAVHSLKDLPSATVEGLVLGACPERGPVEDVLLSAEGVPLEDLPEGAVVGTSSPRRRAWLHAARPDLEVVDIRGNVPTRRAKVLEGPLDATVLARAGLERLGLLDERCAVLPADPFVPAACQGILGIEVREGDPAADLVARIDAGPVRREAACERAFLRRLGAGCQTPVGALARVEGGAVTLRARWALNDEGPPLEAGGRGEDPAEVGRQVAEELLRKRDAGGTR